CKAYTFVNYNKDGRTACYLKKGTGDKRSLPSAVSAVVVPPTAAPQASIAMVLNAVRPCRPVPQQCEAQQVGVDFYGDDISTIYGILPAECCAKCADTAGCKAYTFVNFNSDRGTGNMRALVGAVSAEFLNLKPEPTCATPPYGSCRDSRGAKCCPSGAYCQPWNRDFYQCMHLPVQYLQQLMGVDFYGNGIATFYGSSQKHAVQNTRRPLAAR
uniref:Apple domain-containing protein n=1 Tax=Globisporangium ultimum (strain ATCC 200006 / CBS 805.95 / DAOM BR144) TaxID=431595 RepID=K3WRX0_GLOUD